MQDFAATPPGTPSATTKPKKPPPPAKPTPPKKADWMKDFERKK
jgi:hypothetical protein